MPEYKFMIVDNRNNRPSRAARMKLMDSDLDVGDNLHMRALVPGDARLLTEATSAESAPALWGACPAGPYSLRDARTALNNRQFEQADSRPARKQAKTAHRQRQGEFSGAVDTFVAGYRDGFDAGPGEHHRAQHITQRESAQGRREV